MTTKEKRSAYQEGWLKVNRFKERGFGIIQPDDNGAEVFCHIKGFFGLDTGGITEGAIHRLEYGRRLHFRLTVDPRRGRAVAVDISPIREVQVPDGTILELPLRGDKSRKQAEAERAAKLQAELQPRTDGFGALVASLR